MPRIIGKARRIVFRDEVLYFYRKRAGSRLSVFTRDRLDVLDVVGRIGSMSLSIAPLRRLPLKAAC